MIRARAGAGAEGQAQVNVRNAQEVDEGKTRALAEPPVGSLAALGALLTLATTVLTFDALFRQAGTIDYRVIRWVQRLDIPLVRPLFQGVSDLTGQTATYLLIPLLILAFALVRRWGAVVAAVGIVGGRLLTFGLHQLVDQPRPDADLLLRALDRTPTPAFPSGHVVGAVMLYGLLYHVARRLSNRLIRVGLGGGSLAVIGLIGVARVWLGAHWLTDVVAGYTLGGLFLLALIAIERRVGRACDGIPLVHAAAVPHDESLPHAHALTSTVIFRDGTVSKIYAPGFLPRALYWLAFQAEFPYMRNQAALRAAILRRKLAGLLTEYWYGSNRVARALRIDTIDGRLALTGAFIEAQPPADHHKARSFLFDLCHYFDEAGLPTWQVDPRQPRSLSNILETDGHHQVIDLESGLVSPMASPRAWWRAFRRGLVPLFDDVFFDLTRAYVARHEHQMRARHGDAWLAELRATLAGAEAETQAWHASEPRIWGRLARAIQFGHSLSVPLVPGATQGSGASTLERRQARAARWFDGTISIWREEGRINQREAERLHQELRLPEFLAVLPHFGVHLAIGVALRFPIGSITRASYTLFNLLLATSRFLLRRIDRHAWRQAFGIHSPLVILIAGMPGVGTFAYLASRPIRSHHLLFRVALDAVLLKLPWRIYERLGLRWLIARPAMSARLDVADGAGTAAQRSRRLVIWPQQIVLPLTLVAGAIAAAYVGMVAVDRVFAPSFFVWDPISRILDLDSDSSLANWFAVVSLLVCALLLGIIAVVKHRTGDRFALHWLILAIILLGLSLDEGVKLHDWGLANGDELRDRFGLHGIFHYAWVIPGALSVLVVGLLYRHFVAHLPRQTRRLGILAAVLYVGGELGVELFGSWLSDTATKTSLLYKIEILVEEGLSMAGMLVAIATLLLYMQEQLGDLELRLGRSASQQPSPVAEEEPSSGVLPAGQGSPRVVAALWAARSEGDS